jgi:hypothetical protein
MFNPTQSNASAAQTEANRANATHSTGPKTNEGRQRSAMNGFKHGLTGQRMILQEHEMEPYRRLTDALTAQYHPATEIESQLVQRIIDCNMRLSRIAAIDCNLLNVTLAENTRDYAPDAMTESVIAQTSAWVMHADSFEKLGRYEVRISRQMLQFVRELERIQNLRKDQLTIEPPAPEKQAEPAETNIDETKLASLRTPRVMTANSAAPAPTNEAPTPVNVVMCFSEPLPQAA